MFKKRSSIKFLIFFGIPFFILSCKQEKTKIEKVEISISNNDTSVEKGHYLVTILGCNDCHSPKELKNGIPMIIEEKRLSGFPSSNKIPNFDKKQISNGFLLFSLDGTAAYGPWGISLASNITPDGSGIGNWTLEQFKNALTKGKYKGLENGRTLNPPMPWPNYISMKDEDVKAIFYYLKSIKAVENIVTQ